MSNLINRLKNSITPRKKDIAEENVQDDEVIEIEETLNNSIEFWTTERLINGLVSCGIPVTETSFSRTELLELAHALELEKQHLYGIPDEINLNEGCVSVSNISDKSEMENIPDKSETDNITDKSEMDNIPDNSETDNITDKSEMDNIPDKSEMDNITDKSEMDNIPDNSEMDNIPDNSEMSRVAERDLSDFGIGIGPMPSKPYITPKNDFYDDIVYSKRFHSRSKYPKYVIDSLLYWIECARHGKRRISKLNASLLSPQLTPRKKKKRIPKTYLSDKLAQMGLLIETKDTDPKPITLVKSRKQIQEGETFLTKMSQKRELDMKSQHLKHVLVKRSNGIPEINREAHSFSKNTRGFGEAVNTRGFGEAVNTRGFGEAVNTRGFVDRKVHAQNFGQTPSFGNREISRFNLPSETPSFGVKSDATPSFTSFTPAFNTVKDESHNKLDTICEDEIFINNSFDDSTVLAPSIMNDDELISNLLTGFFDDEPAEENIQISRIQEEKIPTQASQKYVDELELADRPDSKVENVAFEKAEFEKSEFEKNELENDEKAEFEKPMCLSQEVIAMARRATGFLEGEDVKYWSASKNNWLPARILDPIVSDDGRILIDKQMCNCPAKVDIFEILKTSNDNKTLNLIDELVGLDEKIIDFSSDSDDDD